MIILTSKPERLAGELVIPGDKSITHRALILGALADGNTEISGFLDAADCRSTLSCLQALGVNIIETDSQIVVKGKNFIFNKPASTLDAGNSGTTARLLLGLLAGQQMQVTLTGDQSLIKRPMQRVTEPLSLMGASFEEDCSTLPLTIRGGDLKAISYESVKASAQVKSAVLIAALSAKGITSYAEPFLSRDHTELMLTHFGVKLIRDGTLVRLEGGQKLEGSIIKVPGDISTAAFFMVAAAIVPGSEVILRDVGLNPTRTGIIDVLNEMGVDLEVQNERLWGNEPVGDLLIRGGSLLRGVKITGEIIPRLIDEIPVIAVAAALAEGETRIIGAGELRVKETDRLAALSGQLSRLGAHITETEDGLIIKGGSKLTGASVESLGDHRIAMALAVAGLAAEGDTVINEAEAVAISFPGFMQALRSLTRE